MWKREWMRASMRGCRGARARAVARLGAMASAANGSSSYDDTGKRRVRAGARMSGASKLREHDRGDPERGHASTLRLNNTAQLNLEYAGALRARERHGSDAIYGRLHAMGRMGEGGALPSSPKDTKWSTETSWRRRSGALNPWRGPDQEEDGSRGRQGTRRPGHRSRCRGRRRRRGRRRTRSAGLGVTGEHAGDEVRS